MGGADLGWIIFSRSFIVSIVTAWFAISYSLAGELKDGEFGE